jgi:hypothetical protein
LRHVHRVANMRRRAKRQPPPHSRTPLKSAVHPTYADAGVPKRPRHITVWTERPVCLRAPSPMPVDLGFDVGPSRLASRGRPGKHPWALWHRSNPWTPEVGVRDPSLAGCSICARSARLGRVPAHAGWPAHAR